MLHEVVTARDQTLRKPLINDHKKSKNNGFISITGDEKSGSNNEMVELEVSTIFPNKEGFNFFIVQRHLGPGQYIPIYKSEIKPV
jgi:hypothetical protein